MNHKENSITFWNQHFKNYEPMTINQEDITIDSTFDQYLKTMGDQCEHIIDIGCGIGTCLMGSLVLGRKMKKGVGFDTSINAIHFASETAKRSNMPELSFHVADESFLTTLDNQQFDGIICSNFLDVIPKDLSDTIINQMKRILKPGGFLLLKINFYLDDERIKHFNMEQVEENTYQMNGVIRSYNLTTEEWINRFDGFEVVSQGGYQRAENLPEDRIILFSLKE